MLYLTEPIDEVAIQNLAEYDDKKFVDVSREGIDLGADDQDTKKVVPLPSLCILPVLMCMYLERASIWVQTAKLLKRWHPCLLHVSVCMLGSASCLSLHCRVQLLWIGVISSSPDTQNIYLSSETSSLHWTV